MKITHTSGVYSVILSESEWYCLNTIHQDTFKGQVQHDAQEAGCQYVSIIVEPDAVLSISPIAGRHQVWKYTFTPRAEELFKEELTDLLSKYNDIKWVRMAAILKAYSEA